MHFKSLSSTHEIATEHFEIFNILKAVSIQASW